MTSPDTEFISIRGTAGSPEAPQKVSSRSLPETLPILGLSDIVIFPGMVAPLLVETAQSTKLIDDVVGGERLLGVVLQRNAEAENPLPHEMHEVGCAARVLKMLKFPDNTVRVLVEGLWRVRIKDYAATEPYLTAKFELIKDITEDSVELTAMLRNAQGQFQEIIRLSPALSEQIKIAALNTEDPGHFADLIAVNLNLDLAERQKLLETNSVKERLTRLLPMLNREHEVLTLSSKIQTEVATSISKTQRDFFLREQMRAIQRELGESDPNASEIRSLREKIEQAQLPAEAKQVATQELERLQQMPPAAAEYGVTRHYIDWILALPWTTETEDKIDLTEAERILDEQHYGLSKVKDRLIEFLAVIKRRKQIKGPILCLVGPPGVGKTSLGRSVADALGRKFARISLGGMRDEAEIRGHRRTYVGALPGRIIQTLRRVESRNPVILLDELDKVGADFRGDPASALLEVLDPAQNNTFTDHYLDIPFDLSRVLFIATANTMDTVPGPLRDRMEVIEIPGYTNSDKLDIAKRYLVPRQLDAHGLTPQQVKFQEPALRRLITDYTHEAGVRSLERNIGAVSRAIAADVVGGNMNKVTVDVAYVAKTLGPPRFEPELASRTSVPGVDTGMAYTPVGGEILFIEATRMPGRGNITLTGQIGDVMKESATAAFSLLRSRAEKYGIDSKLLADSDIHIHVPAGAIPKDGPSAGVAMFTALASLLTNRPVKYDVAMTGEITLRGLVLPIGGLKEKTLAAKRAGIKQVIVPKRNEKDMVDLPEEVRKTLKFHFVENVDQALEVALEAPKGKKQPAVRKSK